ncbi:hypothetical protein B0H14DRAFT_3483070 [Mycena olivaceomarginata]|nr:hypothetical protein B0H14DRAFT_3483070 [Mycena olivaceomarginata]
MAALPALVAQAVAAASPAPVTPHRLTTWLQPPAVPFIQAPPLFAQPPPLVIPTPFVAPLTQNPAAGAYSSLLDEFPDLRGGSYCVSDPARAQGLGSVQAGFTLPEQRGRQTLSFSGVQLSYMDAAPRDYKSLNAIPTGQSHWVARQFWRYNVHLSKIAAEYELAAVVEYHMEFLPASSRGNATPWGLFGMGTS